MIKTKYKNLQKYLDHYNPDTPQFLTKPSIAFRSSVTLFEEWLEYSGLPYKTNIDGFVIDGENTIQPQFIVNNRYFIDIIPQYKRRIHEGHYNIFTNQFGIVLVIPKDVVPEFVTLTDAEDFYRLFHS